MRVGGAGDLRWTPGHLMIGLIAMTVLTWSLTSEWPSREIVRAVPWYAWLAGGLMGTIYLTGNILLAPQARRGRTGGPRRRGAIAVFGIA